LAQGCFARFACTSPKHRRPLSTFRCVEMASRTIAALAFGFIAGASAETVCADGTSRGRCSSDASAEQEHLLVQMRGKLTIAADYRKCNFIVEPETPHYWDETCTMGMVGCWADGINDKCRFCDYQGIDCPEVGTWRPKLACDFDHEPVGVGYYWDPDCPRVDKGLGCLADGKNQGCRFCGGSGNYSSIPCVVDQCTFENEPATPYYFDETCYNGKVGCLADGIHDKCRFCGRRPFEYITCPDSVPIIESACSFRNQPTVKYYWEPDCTMGMLGCWADGIHAQCRFCDGTQGEFAGVACRS